MEALGINLGYLIVQILNFAIILIVLRAWVYKPLLGMLEKRRHNIAEGLENARVAAEARANAEKEAAIIISEAQVKSSQIIREAMDRAEAAGREVRAQAETDAVKQRNVALAEVQQERERILSDLRGQVTALAIAVSHKLIGESLDEQRQHNLVNEFFSGIKGGNVTLLETSNLHGASAEVTSALPLSAEEKELVRREILAKIGNQATVSFRVDPTILGGLIVRVGDKILDASVANQLEGLRHSLA
ncbi:MAG: F0F1 ATP synthase subunit B [Omnitrophica WOR_2 bacterium]